MEIYMLTHHHIQLSFLHTVTNSHKKQLFHILLLLSPWNLIMPIKTDPKYKA